MSEFVLEYYLWIKTLHFAGFISWMAALFYLPRLFVYHIENKDNEAYVSIVKIQERKLFKAIALPAMLVTVFTGILMLSSNTALLKMPYIHAKLSLVLLLLIYTLDNWCYLKQLAKNECQKSGKFFRIYNEVPTILMFAILIVMIIKPF